MRPVAWIVLAAIAYVAIGWHRAGLVGGFYPWRSAVADGLCAAVIVGAAWGIGVGLQVLLERWIPARVRARSLLIGAGLMTYVFLGVFPMVLTLAQFCPQRVACVRTPTDLRVKSEDVRIESDGYALSGWYLPNDSRQPPVLVLHGIGANKDAFLEPAVWLNELGHPVLTIDLRAHGDSEGRLCTVGVRESHDVSAAVTWISRRHPSRRVCVLAYSMSAAAAMRAAAETGGIDRLAVDSTFARAENVARGTVLKWFGPVREPLWQIGRLWAWAIAGIDLAGHNPEEYLARSQARVLIIHGDQDATIPPSEADRLRLAAGSRAVLWKVPGANHVETLLHPAYAQRVHEFFVERP